MIDEIFEEMKMDDLLLQGKAGDPIWIMADGEEPAVIGIRLDCGDGGVVYVTREQAQELASQLIGIARQLEEPSRRGGINESD